jgi:hypothetical protein
MPDPVLVQRTTQIEDIEIESTTSFSEGAGDARKLGSAARRRNIGAVCSSLKASAGKKLEGVPELWIFNRRDHGGLLQITGERRKAARYDIGNPPTANRMTQHQLPAALFVLRRVVLYENRIGGATFECVGLCRSLDSLARNARPSVARQLDASLERVLVKRPAEQEDING